ncbi:MAG: flap endonuclease-1 [Candidatus Aenigmarchaeota archaeon]|nr:flap endonuclease-1 [Candidatus Aenigmarchaeota archaeon]
MGIQMTSLVEGEEATIEQFFDKKIAVDAYNWIYQFLSIIRQPDGEPLKDSRGRITSHLSGLFYRTMKLMEAGIKPIYVFDGKPPEFKRATADQRRDVRAEAAREWEEALKRKDYEAARKYAQRAVTITGEIVEQSKRLLEAMGLPAVQAPSEGEALCSLMCRRSDVYAVATQDYDSLLFGATRLVRNLSITGKKKRGSEYITINPEMLVLNKVLEQLEITQDQLILLGILIGTDYNPGGVPGYGPKKALELVREKKTLHAVKESVIWDFDVDMEDIFAFFKKPEDADYDITFGKLSEEKIVKMLCDEHDFSEERIVNALKKYKESKGEGQRSLGGWVK